MKTNEHSMNIPPTAKRVSGDEAPWLIGNFLRPSVSLKKLLNTVYFP